MMTFPHLRPAKSNKYKNFSLFVSYVNRTPLKKDPCYKETNKLYSCVKQI